MIGDAVEVPSIPPPSCVCTRCLSDDNGDATDHNGGGDGNGKADGAVDGAAGRAAAAGAVRGVIESALPMHLTMPPKWQRTVKLAWRQWAPLSVW